MFIDFTQTVREIFGKRVYTIHRKQEKGGGPMNEKEFRGNDVDEMIFGCQEQVISSER